jgi:hypothetical protein
LRIAVTYVGRGRYESTFPFERSRVAKLNNISIPFDAQMASVVNWLIVKLKDDEPIV